MEFGEQAERPPELTVKPKMRKKRPVESDASSGLDPESLEGQQDAFRKRQVKKQKMEMAQLRLDAIQAYKNMKAKKMKEMV